MQFLRKSSGRSTPRAAAERSRSGPQRQKSAAAFTWNGEQSLGSLNALPVAPSPPPEKGSMQGLFASVVTAAARDNKATGHLARRNSFGGAAMRTHESDLPRFQRVFFLLFKEWLPCLFPLALAATHISAFWELFQWEDQLVFFAIALLFQICLALAVRLALFLWSKSNPNTGLSANNTTFVDSQARHRRAAAPPRHAPLPAHTSTNPAASLFTTSRGSRSPTPGRGPTSWEASPAMRAPALPHPRAIPASAHTHTPSAARPAPTLA